MTTAILFILGFAVLIKGADLLVDGASAIAKRLNISDMVIGLTIISIGTSSPEMFVNIIAATKGTTDLAIGNIVGSNIANIFLVLGITAVICPIAVSVRMMKRELPFSILAALILGIMANDIFLRGADSSVISRIDGIILFLLFNVFLLFLFKSAKRDQNLASEHAIPGFGVPKSIMLILLGLAGLSVGSDWIVDGAIEIARIIGISEKTIGLTIVAFGTSLPELAASAAAALKKNVDLAVGNVIGSNIFNVFLILGISSIIRPLPFQGGMNIDIGVMFAANLFILLFVFTGRKKVIERWEGMVMFILYLAYIAFLYLSPL